MNLEIKKTIAREFLILIFSLSIGFVSFLCTYPYNTFKRYKKEQINSEIIKKNKLYDSISALYISKIENQEWFFNKLVSNYSLIRETKYNTREKLWKRLNTLASKDSIKYKWDFSNKDFLDFHNEIGFSDPEALQTFILKNRLSKKDSINYNTGKAIKLEINELGKNMRQTERNILSFKNQIQTGKQTFFICVILLFGIRYLFYSIAWSLNVLRK
ncbi:MAG TPA: hypothetical protein PKA12_16765 [Saprospiraceae bacterium]|nr:hypothetical protein [Saprospiraceae bacterium]